MAHMIPDYSSSLYSSIEWQGERDVFEALKNRTPSSWTVLHSLRLKNHRKKALSEADFVIITDNSVLVLEVKGGKIRRDSSGKWIQEKKGCEPIIKYDGPFKQAVEASYNIRDYLKESCRRQDLADDLNWGSGVITPHCSLVIPTDDPEIDRIMLLNRKSFPDKVHSFCLDLNEYWLERNSRNNKHSAEKISDKNRIDLIQLLRPEIDETVSAEAWMDEAEQEMIFLTDQQIEVLDLNRENPRVLISGPSGTGKTIIAFEQALRKSREGKRVLFICFNRNLAEYLKERAIGDTRMENITIGNYHQIVTGLIRKAGFGKQIDSNWNKFNENCSELIRNIFNERPGMNIWDYLIVDEAQDLMSETFLSCLDKLVKHGLTDGDWLFLYDDSQNIYTQKEYAESFFKIRNCSAKASLSKNCRNTDRIAEYILKLSNTGSRYTRLIHGSVPVIDYYQSTGELSVLLQKYVNEEIHSLTTAGRNPSDLIILTPEKRKLPEKCFEPHFFDRKLDQYPVDNSDSIRYSTIHSYKGLESSCVILIGFDELDSEESRRLFYIGAGRARFRLIWLAHEDLSTTVLNRLSSPIQNSTGS